METDAILENWALWAAIVPATIVLFAVGIILYRRSASGQLARACRNYRAAEKALSATRKSLSAAKRRLAKLEKRNDRVKPRVLQEAREAVQDYEALEKIADDRSQVMMNHLRRVIFEEYPPATHDKMRRKYLPQDVEDGRPFSF